MSLTVADVLALPGLESLRLRAGADACANPVRWPYVAENSGIAEWVMGGELVFITGINHPRDPANLLQVLEEGRERGIAGVVILTGPDYIKAIPKQVAARADALQLPLIEQPYTLKMVVVTQAIGTALVQAQLMGRSRRDVLEQLLEGRYPSFDLLRQRASALGLPLEVPRQVALFRLQGSEVLFNAGDDEAAERTLQHGQQRLQQVFEACLKTLGDPLDPLLQGDQWVLLLPARERAEASANRQFMLEQVQALNQQLAPLRLFVGMGNGGHGPSQYARGLDEARQALDAAHSFPERAGLCCYNELGVLRLLAAIGERSSLDHFVQDTLGPVLADDQRHEAVLLPTLEAWFHENGNLVGAAKRLQVHRNTLAYRVSRIESLTGLSFNDPHDRLNASIALLIWRLRAAQG